jgi:hypothetical protein
MPRDKVELQRAEGDERVRDWERRFLPALRAAEAEINAGSTGVRAGVWSQPCGQATDSPGHVIALSCLLPGAPSEQADEVTLELCFSGIRRPEPTVEAHVVWDYPGQLEADLFPVAVAVSEDALQRIEAELPRLLEALQTALRKGRPPE